jgi:beta-lactam-binding protein with PASTA domain
VASAKSTLEALQFEVAIDPVQVASTCPAGTVANTDPQGTTSAGSQVSLVLSNGTPAGGPPPGGPPGGPPGRGGGGGGGG